METPTTFALGDVECVADLDFGLRQFWRAHSSTRDADPDFTDFFVRTISESGGMRCFVIRAEGEPIAMLVGRLEQTSCPLKIGHFKLAAPKLRALIVPHGGWLGRIDGEQSSQLIRALEHLMRISDVEMVLLHGIDTSSHLAKAALVEPHFLCRDKGAALHIHRYLTLAKNGAGFMSSLSGNERRQQAKRGRKLAERFSKVDIRCFSKPDEVETLMTLAERIACKSYQRRIDVGFTNDDRLRARLLFEAQVDWLRGFVLLVDDSPIAFWIGSLRAGVFYSDYLSFDPDFGEFSPGVYLTMEVIDTLSKEQGLCRVDFGSGEGEYKRRLSNEFVEEARICVFKQSPRSMALNILRGCCSLITSLGKSLLQRAKKAGLGKGRPKLPVIPTKIG